MRKLDVSSVTDVSQIKIKQGTLQFLQDANAEAFAAIIIGLIGATYNPATVYILYGPTLADWATPNYSGPAGASFYNGEVFLIDAQAFTITGSNVPVFSLIVTQFTVNADPVTFSDATVRNVHNIRKMLISAAASGSGIADFSTAVFLSFAIPAQVALTGAGVTGAYPNYVIAGPNGINPILAAGNQAVGDVGSGGGTDIAVVFVTPLATANYYVMGTVVSLGTPANDSTTSHSIRNKTNTGFTVHFQEFAGLIQNISFDWIVFAK